MKRLIHALILTALLPFAAHATDKVAGKLATEMPNELKGIGITEHLGQKIDKTLTFKDEDGKDVQLGQFFQKKPVFLTLVYYGCPNLCSYYLNGVMDAFKGLKLKAGKDFEFVVVSIDPTETPALAKEKKAAYIKEYGHLGDWHFLTGADPQIKRLAEEVGFGYRWDEAGKQYAHTSASYILTPSGDLSRYLYGINFDLGTLKFSLIEASMGQIGTLLEKAVLFCFRFDSHANKYTFYAFNIMRAGAGLTVVIMGFIFIPIWRREKRKGEKGPASHQGDV